MKWGISDLGELAKETGERKGFFNFFFFFFNCRP